MSEDKEILAAIKRARAIAVVCHTSPDGDAIGSALGLALRLKRSGRNTLVTWGNEPVRLPPLYTYLPGADLLTKAADVPDDVDLWIAVDCADGGRLLALQERFLAAEVSINIDHHISNTRFATINEVDGDASSTSEMVFDILQADDANLNADEAICLYTGIVTDSGRFQYPATTPRTLRVAAELRAAGADHVLVGRSVYQSAPFDYLRLASLVLSRATLEDGVVASWFRLSELRDVALEETEHLIDLLRGVRESRLTILLKQKRGGWKASLRSNSEVDASKIAAAFGGGGHAQAAGCDVTGTAKSAIAAIRQAAASQ